MSTHTSPPDGYKARKEQFDTVLSQLNTQPTRKTAALEPLFRYPYLRTWMISPTPCDVYPYVFDLLALETLCFPKGEKVTLRKRPRSGKPLFVKIKTHKPTVEDMWWGNFGIAADCLGSSPTWAEQSRCNGADWFSAFLAQGIPKALLNRLLMAGIRHEMLGMMVARGALPRGDAVKMLTGHLPKRNVVQQDERTCYRAIHGELVSCIKEMLTLLRVPPRERERKKWCNEGRSCTDSATGHDRCVNKLCNEHEGYLLLFTREELSKIFEPQNASEVADHIAAGRLGIAPSTFRDLRTHKKPGNRHSPQ
ncbi:MAG: hypothetical protein V2A77_09125 [Pseudomonadota bacterium]